MKILHYFMLLCNVFCYSVGVTCSGVDCVVDNEVTGNDPPPLYILFNNVLLDVQILNYCQQHNFDEKYCAYIKLQTFSTYYHYFLRGEIEASDIWRVAKRPGYKSAFKNNNQSLLFETHVNITGGGNYSTKLQLIRNEFTLDEQVSVFCNNHGITSDNCQLLKLHTYQTYQLWLFQGGIDDLSRVIQIPGVNAISSNVLTVHTIGDSHALCDFNIFDYLLSNPNFSVGIALNLNSLGPKLMNSVGRDGIIMPNFKLFSSQLLSGDVIVFAFGEIDVRCHVNKYVEKSGVINVIHRLVTNYYASIVKWIAKLSVEVHVWIQGVPPPAVIQNSNYKNFPTAGSLSERTLYSVLMNHFLDKYSLKHGFTFLDMFDEYVSDWGVLKDEHIKDFVHVGNYSRATKLFVAETIAQYISKI